MKYYVNENIRNTVRVFPDQGRYDYLRYDMNENPEGLPEAFVKKVLSEITPSFLSIYPEPNRFVQKYADFIGCDFNQVLTTNGSDMAIRYILETFGEPGKNVVTVSPSFEMYWVNCNILGLKHKPVEYEPDLTIDIQKIVAAIDEDTRVVVLLNPNNPVGNVYTQEEFQAVLKKTKEVGAILIVDEAYHYFYRNTFVESALTEENVLVLRTFSKLFSIAACRLGVIIGNEKLIDYVRRSRLTFDVNSIALLFGERILDEKGLLESLIKIQQEGKEYTLNTLKMKNYECKDCKGNFIFIKPKSDALLLTEKLKTEKKILVHGYRNALLKDYIRVSTGSIKAMKIFLDAFFELDKQ
ncbi:MAG: histidinol-phosphate aminotransferase family protein [Anaeroplasmataceae bacterium]|nr:histidinol-phosphate aminotransferase family protein [Anaeroplasmataceae bacterium]